MSFDAFGAGFDPTVLNFEPLQIGIKPSFGCTHGVRSSKNTLVAFAANRTFAHRFIFTPLLKVGARLFAGVVKK